MAVTIGIDLGTTYSSAAYIDGSGRAEVIQSSEGKKITPSVVLFDSKEEIVVGDVAKENAIMRPHDVVQEVKNKMGERCVVKTLDGIEYTPEMVSSFILRKVVQDAENALGEKISGVVITVPAAFADPQRQATIDAAKLAGIPFLATINEPTAAALCYIEKQNNEKESIEKENILVYDLGGGTFDVTVLRVENESDIEVKATGGLSNAGGCFFDQAIVDFVCDHFIEKHQLDLYDEDYMDELQELYNKAENAKQQLSSRKSVKINMKIGDIKEQIQLTREQFEAMIKNTYLKTERKMKDVIREAGLNVEDIDRVLMVGGSTRIPYVHNSVREFMGIEPSKEMNPNEAVAMGAAIYAKMYINKGAEKRTFMDVCSHGIGVVVLNSRRMEENEVVIGKNSKLPAEAEKRFRTVVANQKKLTLTLTEGEYKEITDVTKICDFDIILPEKTEENALILLKISLDFDQIIHVRFELPDANFTHECNMNRFANMDEVDKETITGMLRDYSVN